MSLRVAPTPWARCPPVQRTQRSTKPAHVPRRYYIHKLQLNPNICKLSSRSRWTRICHSHYSKSRYQVSLSKITPPKALKVSPTNLTDPQFWVFLMNFSKVLCLDNWIRSFPWPENNSFSLYMISKRGSGVQILIKWSWCNNNNNTNSGSWCSNTSWLSLGDSLNKWDQGHFPLISILINKVDGHSSLRVQIRLNLWDPLFLEDRHNNKILGFNNLILFMEWVSTHSINKCSLKVCLSDINGPDRVFNNCHRSK